MGHALASACHQGLIREFKLPTQGEAKRFSKALAAWNAASNLNDESFRECFTHGLVDDLATVRRLRQAAAGSVTARTFGQMVDVSRPLTAAIKDIGAHRWTYVREELEDRAEKSMPVQLAAETLPPHKKPETGQPSTPKTEQPPVPKGCEVGTPPQGKGSTEEQRNRFYDCLYDKLEAMAKRLGIKVEWLLGLAALESSWLDEHNWALRNPFGLTESGHNNLCFNTFQSAADYWERHFGPKVKGAKSLDEFLDKLKGDGKYNEVKSNWKQLVKDTINSQAHFIDDWRRSKSGNGKSR